MDENIFDEWNELKKNIENEKAPQFHIREIWYCSLGKNIGMEEDGKNEKLERPVLIIRKFNMSIFLALPLSSRHKDLPYYFLLDYPHTSSVLLSQIRVLDAKRLIRKVRTINKEEFDAIRKKFKELI